MKKGCKKTYSTYPSQVANVLLSTCRTRMVQHRKDIERHNLSCWQNRTKVDQPKQNLMGSKFFNRFPNSHILQVFTGHAAVFSQSLMQSALQKKSWGTRAWHLSNYVHVKLHLLDVFSLASKGVWQQAGLQHIGFAAHVCRSFELVFSWMFFVCLSAAVSCVYGLGGKRIVIYSTKDMFNVDQDQNFQKQSIFKVSMCQDFPFWRQKSIYSVYAGAIKKGLRHVGKLGKVVPQDREVTLMEWRCSG